MSDVKDKLITAENLKNAYDDNKRQIGELKGDLGELKSVFVDGNILGILNKENKVSTSYNTSTKLPNWEKNVNYETFTIPVNKARGILYISKAATEKGQKYFLDENGETKANTIQPNNNLWFVGVSIKENYYAIDLATAYNYGVRFITWTWDISVEKDYYINANEYIAPDWIAVELKNGQVKTENIANHSVTVDKLEENILDEIPDILLDDTYVAVVGIEFNIYNQSIISVTNINNFYITWSYTGNGFNQYDDRCSIIETSTGTHTLTFELRKISKNYTVKKLYEKEITINVIENTPKITTALLIGDSRTQSGVYVNKIKELYGESITLLGTRQSSEGNKHEGRNGWSVYNYLNAQIKYGIVNPFYDPDNTWVIQSTGDTVHFSFEYYMTQQGYDSVDIVTILLGANDGFTDYAAKRIEAICENIHSYDPNIKIIIMKEYLSPWSYIGTINGGNRRIYQAKYNYHLDNFITDSNVTICPIIVSVDGFYDWNRSDISVSSESTEKRKYITDIVHCGETGYKHIANMLYGYMLKVMS